MDSALLASLLTALSGVLALAVARIRCVYKWNKDGECDPRCGCTDQPLTDPDELEFHKVGLDNEVLMIIKKS